MRALCDKSNKYIKKPCLRTESADFGIDIGVVDAHWLVRESTCRESSVRLRARHPGEKRRRGSVSVRQGLRYGQAEYIISMITSESVLH